MGQLTEGSVVSLFRYSLERLIERQDDGFCYELTGHSMESLLGSSSVNPDGFDYEPREYKRPLWRETEAVMEAVKRDVVAYSVPELADMVLTDIPRFLGALGAESLPLKDIWLGYYIYKTTYKGLSLDMQVPEELASRVERAQIAALITRDLVEAICIAEGLFGPNSLGYVPDQNLSLSRRDQIKFDLLGFWVVPLLNKQPNLLGPETKDIVNRVIDRLERTRERTSDGRLVDDRPLPRLL